MSFRLKTIIGVAAIEAILLAILVFSGLRWLHDSNEEQLIQRVATTARLFATTTKNAVLTMDLASLESFVREALTNPGVVYARVRDESGKVLAQDGDEKVLARPFAADNDPSTALDGVFDTYADIREGGAYFGRVEVGLSVDSFQLLMRDARSGAIAIAGLEMLLVALFSLLLGTYLTRQLTELREASNRIGREGPGLLIPVTGKDEVAQAISAFNTMSARLADSSARQARFLEESRELAARIRASEVQKAAMLNAALDAIITIDLDGRILEYNASAEQIFGYPRDEAVGRLLDELIIPDRHREAHRQGMDRFRESGVGRVLGKHLELPALHKSGREFPMEVAITHLETEQGSYFTAFMRDISDRKRSEEELRLAAYAFEAQEAIFVTDAEARILRVNQPFTAITGYTADEAIGQTPRLLKSGHQDADFYRRMWSQLRSDGHWEGEIENRRKNGDVFPEWLSITAVRDAQGQTTNYVAHFIDISERKRSQAALEEARERAEQASEAKSRFLATMSHEIRTPLNAILNMSDLLVETDLNAEQRSYATTVSEAGRNLLSIVNSILDFSKIEAGRMEKHPEPCDPADILESVVRLLAPRAFSKGLELTLFVAPEAPRRFTTDPGLLRQILLNLVGNAIKFTETGGVRARLLLDTEQPGGPWVRFDVIDTGIGISADKQGELFTEFSQVDSSHTRRFGGTGLGLAISRFLARILGGDVVCHSEPDRGSCFSLILPASDMEPLASEAPALADLLKARRVLCYSANPILADEIVLQLRALGLDARVADRLPGDPAWLADPRCGGGITLVEPDQQDLHATTPAGDAGLPIRLVHSERAGGGAEDGCRLLTARLPIAPGTLYRLLRQAAGQAEPLSQPQTTPVRPVSLPAKAAGKAPILLVEDSPPNRLVATAILSKAGYDVESAENGVQAVSAVKQKRYGLVLMDVAMPEMDGLEATRAIRALGGERAQVPIVAMTAGAFNEDKERCLSAGMDDFIGKPVVREDLLKAVERWLQADAAALASETASPSPVSLESILLDEAVLRALQEDLSPELLPGALKAFVDDARRRVSVIEEAVRHGNLVQVRREAHAIKGAAGTFGASALRMAAAELEAAGGQGQDDVVGAQLHSFIQVARDTLALLVQRFAIDIEREQQ